MGNKSFILGFQLLENLAKYSQKSCLVDMFRNQQPFMRFSAAVSLTFSNVYYNMILRQNKAKNIAKTFFSVNFKNRT